MHYGSTASETFLPKDSVQAADIEIWTPSSLHRVLFELERMAVLVLMAF